MFYDSWEDVFDRDGTVEDSSSTSLDIFNSDGTITRIIGVGLTYTEGALSGGTLTGLERYDPVTDTTLVSLTGGSRPVADVLAELETIEDIQTELLALQPFFDIEDADEPTSWSPTLIEFTADSGNTLQFFGTSFGPDLQNIDFENGNVTEMRVIDSNGTVLGTSGAVSFNLRLVSFAFDGESGYIIDSAFNASTDVFVDDTYSSDDDFLFVERDAVAKDFDINAGNFFGVSYYDYDGVLADLAAGTVVRDGITDTFTGNPNGFGLLETSEGDDTITMGGNVFRGVYAAGGDDSILGSAGADQIEGGGGDDTIEGGAGADTMWGNGFGEDPDFNDTLSYESSDAGVRIDLDAQTASGGHADGDTFDGFANVIGSAFGDRLFGDDGENTLRGEGGNDTLRGEAGADELIGGSGVDWAVYATSDESVFVDLENGTGTGGHAEGDTLSGIERVSGSAFGDRLYGDAGDNLLRGNGGDDIMRGGEGADALFGGSGFDHALYNNSDAGVTVNLTTGSGSGGHAQGDTFSSIEFVTGSNGFSDRLFGNAADNLLRGNGGNDTLRGEDGADVIVGGSGSDWSVYTTSDAGVTVSLATGTGSGGHAAGDTLSGIEKLSGSAFNDRLFGDDASNVLRGNGGDDVLRGEGGADQLIGGGGSDWAVYATSASAVTVDLAAGTGSGGDAAGDTLSGIEKLSGSAHNDRLFGDDGANVLRGNGGNDVLRGEDGGDDLIGGSGTDWAVYVTSDEAVTVDLATGTGSGGHAEGDTLNGIERLSGSAFGDTLNGNAGVNLLRGNNGDDTLNGRGGNDTLIGGNGNDTFVFEADWGNDVVTDFNVAGSEVLDFSALGIDVDDLTIDYGTSDTTITFDGNEIELAGSTATLQSDDFLF